MTTSELDRALEELDQAARRVTTAIGQIGDRKAAAVGAGRFVDACKGLVTSSALTRTRTVAALFLSMGSPPKRVIAEVLEVSIARARALVNAGLDGVTAEDPKYRKRRVTPGSVKDRRDVGVPA